MTTRCTIAPEMLVALVRGELPADAARELETHAGRCEDCRVELTWLRAERQLLAARATAAPTPPPRVWQAIERRTGIARARMRRRLVAGGGAFALVAAAALTLALCRPARPAGSSPGAPVVAQTGADASALPGAVRPTPPDERPAPPPADGDQALARAEDELDQAIGTLQAEYAKKRATMPPERAQRADDNLAAARAAVDEARRHAGNDPGARRRVLRARFRYMHSMQEVVLSPSTPTAPLPDEPTNGEK